MGLLADGLELQPEDPFLGHFDQRPVLVARVRDHDQVFFPESLGMLEDVIDSLGASRLFIGDQGDPDVQTRLEVFRLKRLDGEERSDQVLLVVLDPAAEDLAALNPGLVRVAPPLGEVAGRDNIHVGHNPGGPRSVFPFENGQDVGPVAAGCVQVGGLDEVDVVELQQLEKTVQEFRLLDLALSAA